MKTTKIGFAAALISLGAGIKEIDKTDPRRMEFHLVNASPVIDDEYEWFLKRKDEWDNRTLQVNGRAYLDALEALKIEVHKL